MKNRIVGGIAITLIATGAFAGTTWDFANNVQNSAAENGGYALSSDGVVVNATAWADTGVAANNVLSSSGVLAQQMAQASSSQTHFYNYGSSYGLGINNIDGCSYGYSTNNRCDKGDTLSSAPEHAIDNNGRYEMVLLSFSSLVNLTGFEIGYRSGDSDMTVLAYTGSDTPGLAGKNWSDLAAANSGWSFVGNYADVATDATKATDSNVFSSFWLIGAYNPLAGKSEGWSLGNDYVKLASVTGAVCTNCAPPPPPGNNVPEPGSLALLGLGLLGVIGVGWRRKA